MYYIRWKEEKLRDNKYDNLKRGCVYRDAQGNVFLYVGYCLVALTKDNAVEPFYGQGNCLILLTESYTSPILEVVIKNLDTVLSGPNSTMYTNLSDDDRDGGRTLFIDADNEHELYSQLIEFEVPDEVLWKIQGLFCNYTEMCSIPTYSDFKLKILRLQNTKSYAAYICSPDLKSEFYEVSNAGETLVQFKDRVGRKAELFLKLKTGAVI